MLMMRNSRNGDPLWLIGTGLMADSYSEILDFQSLSYTVVGRSIESSKNFSTRRNINPFVGGCEKALKELETPKTAIVAVGQDSLAKVAIDLLSAGCKRVLLEKPGALYSSDLNHIKKLSDELGASVFIGYNRRHYSNIENLLSLVQRDKGILSCNFEFTEWSHIVSQLSKEHIIKDRWVLSNSSHVLDLVFFIIGLPSLNNMNCYTGGSLAWHTSASRFCGSGITQDNILFSYSSDWQSQGRWKIEIMTNKFRYLLSPLEKLSATPVGSLDSFDIDSDTTFDNKFKPGLYLQTTRFLNWEDHKLCTLDHQIKSHQVYCKIAGYNP